MRTALPCTPAQKSLPKSLPLLGIMCFTFYLPEKGHELDAGKMIQQETYNIPTGD